jgi:hypothetical protein
LNGKVFNAGGFATASVAAVVVRRDSGSNPAAHGAARESFGHGPVANGHGRNIALGEFITVSKSTANYSSGLRGNENRDSVANPGRNRKPSRGNERKCSRADVDAKFAGSERAEQRRQRNKNRSVVDSADDAFEDQIVDLAYGVLDFSAYVVCYLIDCVHLRDINGVESRRRPGEQRASCRRARSESANIWKKEEKSEETHDVQ